MVSTTVTPMATIKLTASGRTAGVEALGFVVVGSEDGPGAVIGGVGMGVGDRRETVTDGCTQSASEGKRLQRDIYSAQYAWN